MYIHTQEVQYNVHVKMFGDVHECAQVPLRTNLMQRSCFSTSQAPIPRARFLMVVSECVFIVTGE